MMITFISAILLIGLATAILTMMRKTYRVTKLEREAIEKRTRRLDTQLHQLELVNKSLSETGKQLEALRTGKTIV